jgi:tRNA threonylcarbamoyl adenosine modification protein YeaZ
MSVLGINCATERLGVAVLHNNQLTEKYWQGQTIKSEQLILLIAETLAAAGCALTEVSAVAVAVGPGAFTGLRLSIVTAKTICLEKQIPCHAISTLEALYQQYGNNDRKTRVILEACRGEVSTALFAADGTRLEPDHPVVHTTIVDESDTFVIENVLPDAGTLCQLAAQRPQVFSRSAVLAITPKYSHESRVNKTTKPELQHLKIGTKS